MKHLDDLFREQEANEDRAVIFWAVCAGILAAVFILIWFLTSV
jgi:asparagine N-glycosylation enzyme membrane subunit Stt3